MAIPEMFPGAVPCRKCAAEVRVKTQPCCARGLEVTRHPWKGAAERCAVCCTVTEENKADLRLAALYSAGKLPRVNLLILREEVRVGIV